MNCARVRRRTRHSMDEQRTLISAEALAWAYVARAKAANTQRTYQADWRHIAA